MGSCWMGDHIKSSKASSWMGDEIKRRIPLNYLFICYSIVPNWVLIQLAFYIPPNFPRALGKGAVSSSFFFLLTICFFSRMLNWISTKLGQNDQWINGYKSYQQFDLKGHVGVTGVKKVNHVKNMKTALISKLIMSSCWQQTKLQKSQWWPCHTTPHIGVKGQNVSYFQFF